MREAGSGSADAVSGGLAGPVLRGMSPAADEQPDPEILSVF